MDGLAAKAVAVKAASHDAISAATTSFGAAASKAAASSKRLLKVAGASLTAWGRGLAGHAARMSRQAVALSAASAAFLVSLAVLALPSEDGGQEVATLELALDDVSLAVAPPAPRVPNLGDPEPVGALAAGALSSGAISSGVSGSARKAPAKQTKEPNLAGLAEIPKDLLQRQPEHKEDDTRTKPSFATPSAAGEKLPWDAVEPVTFTPMGPGQQHAPGQAPNAANAAPAAISDAEIGKWLKGKATKIMGAERTKPLYHFVIWLEPPAALQAHVSGVSYDFSSPAVQPQSQASNDRGSGFKINAAGLACADEITVTLRFDDGRVETTNIDGCKLFDKA